MSRGRAFADVKRASERERDVTARVLDYAEVTVPLALDEAREQGARCMACGVPFCHSACPLGNVIPEWNDLVADGEIGAAIDRLHATNNFPEITGRVCPAPCEASCVLAIEDHDGEASSVAIKSIERVIADAALERGLAPRRARVRSRRRVAVVGSGPAGLAAAQELARMGHDVVVFERDDEPGGLLRYGIPDFKLDKAVLDARLAQMRAEGVAFRCDTEVEAPMLASFDATVLAVGAARPRELVVPGRALDGVVLAMDFLVQSNRRGARKAPRGAPIIASGKRVVVIGGGDTGSDCVGTASRQGAASVLQLEILPRPPLVRASENAWPDWPLVLRTSSSHAEGAERDWAIMTRRFCDAGDGGVGGLEAVRVERRQGAFQPTAAPVVIPCDLAVLALGFEGPETALASSLGVAVDARGRLATRPDGATNVPNVFAAGDASRGPSLVVWAIADGRRAASAVNARLAHTATNARELA